MSPFNLFTIVFVGRVDALISVLLVCLAGATGGQHVACFLSDPPQGITLPMGLDAILDLLQGAPAVARAQLLADLRSPRCSRGADRHPDTSFVGVVDELLLVDQFHGLVCMVAGLLAGNRPLLHLAFIAGGFLAGGGCRCAADLVPQHLAAAQLPCSVLAQGVVHQRAANAVHQHHLGQFQIIVASTGYLFISVEFQALRVAILVTLVLRHQRCAGIGWNEWALQCRHFAQLFHTRKRDLVLRLVTVVAVVNAMRATGIKAQRVTLPIGHYGGRLDRFAQVFALCLRRQAEHVRDCRLEPLAVLAGIAPQQLQHSLLALYGWSVGADLQL